ncbi:MAG TPA: carboxypeptidase regulatory-like domain-containing protein [Terriglobales bacterium]|nr:carboxypeptidase regulatory-like domain-containing protein [Terriglobales bacterium]
MNKLKASVFIVLMILALGSFAAAQRVTGGIAGTVTDPQGAVVSGAKVTITNPATNYTTTLTTTAQGTFEAASLPPAEYKVTVEAGGFATYTTNTIVRVGVNAPVTAKLGVAGSTTSVDVTADAVTVDTTKATVQGIVTATQVENLPLNGRNFLSLAALEPGVQIVDGGSFDPTKNGFAGVAIGGRSGRVTRIQVDGVDVTDETVGTTVTNISSESIQEFGIAQSSLDPSTDMTSSGAVNIITKSGTNTFHGSGLFQYKNQDMGADPRLTKTGPKPAFDREIWAARLGGPIFRDRLFFHAEYENLNQDASTFTNVPEFPQFTGTFGTPFDERIGGARLDWNITNNLRAFGRFNHNDNLGATGFGNRDLASFSNRNNTHTYVAGLDFGAGRWTHAFRFSYLNFNNFVEPANTLTGTPPTLDPAGKPILLRITGILQDVGPDLLAPQQTFQDNKQIKYDGSFTFGRHTLRAGYSYNRIDEAVFANFFGVAARIRASYNATTRAFAAANPFAAGGIQNPLNFPNNQIVLGNGLGAFSEIPALGFQFGGTINHRTGVYVQDSWRVTPNFTFNAGLRWVYNSGLNDSDLDRTSFLALFDPKIAARPRKDLDNFAPQVGFAWNLFGNSKTVVRGGAGVFYETNIINNLLNDRVLNLPPGFGNDTPVLNAGSPQVLHPGTGAVLFNFSTQCTNAGGPGVNTCFGAPLGRVIPFVQQAQALLQTATAGFTANYPPAGVPPLFNQNLSTGGSLLDPDYQTPYSIQMNIGVQHEIKSGLVMSVDYIRNRGARFLQVTELNRIGAANTLNVPAAQAAIAATQADFGCATNACVIAAGGTISDYAANGLGSGTGDTGAAFGGVNRNFHDMGVLRPQGLSLYQALQFRLNGNVASFSKFKKITASLSYSLGKAESTGTDQDFSPASVYNDRPTAFFGPAGTDRRHSFAGSIATDLPGGFNINIVTRIASPLATNMFLDGDGSSEDIFWTDLDGDGVTADPITGTNRGAFGRSVSPGNINDVIGRFNTSVAGTLSPAANALVAAGLFTTAELKSLNAVIQPVTAAPTNQMGNDWLYNTDLRLSNKIRIGERFIVEPMVEMFNVFNIANYQSLNNILSGSPGTINGTATGVNPNTRGVNRIGSGSGAFSPGGLRSIQFGVRFTF